MQIRVVKDSQTVLQYPSTETKRFGRAISDLMLANIFPWVVVRYVINDDYARVSMKTINYNIKPRSWTWDNDNFQVNQIGHPFHGSLFYNSFRSNGYNFWQSIPAPFFGSYIWETFAETQAPSSNDQINTGLGGIIMGEAIHRFISKIINGKSLRFRRQVGEVFSFLIDPMNGFNRLLDGKWGKAPVHTTQTDASIIKSSFDIGYRTFSLNPANPLKSGNPGVYGRINLNYDNPSESLKVPFSKMTAVIEFGQDRQSKLNIVSIDGSLIGWNLSTEKTEHFAVLSANYEYINNKIFYVGDQRIIMNLYSDIGLTKKLSLNTILGAGPVILAAVPDRYKFNTREYDYGPGLAIRMGGRLSFMQSFFYNLNYQGMWTKTINGNTSNYFLHTITNEIYIKIKPRCFLSTELGHFVLNGHYKLLPDVYTINSYLRISFRYMVDL